eukprot:766490-Hanusia_phi.AAC.5
MSRYRPGDVLEDPIGADPQLQLSRRDRAREMRCQRSYDCKASNNCTLNSSDATRTRSILQPDHTFLLYDLIVTCKVRRLIAEDRADAQVESQSPGNADDVWTERKRNFCDNGVDPRVNCSEAKLCPCPLL